MKKQLLLITTLLLYVMGLSAATVESPPTDFVNLYSLQYQSDVHTQVDMAGAVDAGAEKLLVGPGQGWGDGNFFYDVSKYDSLSFKFTFDPADAGKQIAIRIAWDKKGVTLYELTYPADGSTSMIHNISLDGKSHLDGMNFYNGKSHWSFSYTGTAATQAMSIDYIALKTVIPTAVSIEAVDPVLAQGLPLGLTTQLNAVFAPVKATYNDVVWESLNTELATVDATGLVTANTTQAGVASIKVSSVTYPELTATFDVTIVDALTPVSGVELDLSAIQLKVLTSKTLVATVLPSTATNRNIVWSSSDESIATVDQAGLITPVSGGTVDIVVETEDGSFKDTCVVTVVGPLAIPAAYTSLYTLNFNDAGTSKLLSANLTDLGANLPAVFSSDATGLLGTTWNWNAADKYVDLSAYTELQVACAFKTEDIGKKFDFRYAFSTLTSSNITNRVVEITSEEMLLTVDLDADTADVDGLKRLGAVKFRKNVVDGAISFVVDYIAVKAAPIVVKSVALTDTAVVMALGENYTLEYNVLPVDAADKTVVWSSSNEAAATVEDGVLTAVSPGATLVKVFAATDNSLVDSCLVTVTNIPSGSVNLYSLQYQSDVHQQVDMSGTVDAGAEKLLVGPADGWGSGNHYYDIANYDSLSFKLTFDPADAGKQVVLRIAYDKPGVVTLYELTYPTDGSTSMIHNISLEGKSHLDGMNFYNGAPHWNITYTGTAATQAMTIDYVALKTVIPTGVSIEAADPVLAQALPLGLTTQLNAVFAPVNATYNDVVWESLNTDLATVDATGLVTANTTQAGVASIKVSSVTYPALADTFEVTIVDATTPVSGVELDLSSIQLKMLTSKTLTATVMPSDATLRNVVWSSSNESIATVDQAGLITPVSGGTVDIVVETEDGSFKDTCVVTVAGHLPIPAGYVSLYTLNYSDAGTSKLLSANLTDLGANLPAVFSSDATGLLGTTWNWNAADKYVDLSAYTELQVACAFKTEDIGKKLEFRYAFSTLTGSIITNRVVEITSEAMLLTVDLDADTADVDGLKRVGAVKFRNNVSGDISFVVDYIAVKAAPIAVSSIALTDTAVVMALGENYTLEYNVLPVDAADKTVVWSSSNEAAATVEDGVLTAVSPGTTLVKVFAATDNSLVDSCLVTVTNIPSGSVNLYSLQYQSDVHTQVDMAGAVDAGAEKLLVGPGQGWGDGNFFYDVSKYDSLSFKFTFDPADAGKQIAIRIAWDKKGVTLYELTYPADGSTSMIHNISLEGKSHLDGMNFYNGKSHWSFSYTGTAATQAMTIDYVALKTVIPTGVSIEAADPVLAQALPLGLTTQLNAVFAPVKATYNDVVWESLNTDLATVDATGLVTANTTQAGVASIKVSSVTYPALADTFEVTIVDATTPVSGVELDLSSIQLKMLTSKTLVATVMPSDATIRNVVWSSSDESIATVDQAGLITPVSGGTVDIVVETEDGSFKDTCVVTVAGHLPIPAGYVSLYTLNYSDAGTSKLLSANLTDLGANLPAVFSSDVTGLLGYAWSWNAADKYVDLTAYSELQVACAFKTEDIGKKFDFRYAFSTLTGSIITNRVVEITSEEMLLTVDLDADTADVDGLKRLGAVKFRNNVDGAISFVVDYIAVKVAPIVVKSVALTDTAVVLAPGASQTLEYSVLPANAEDLSVTWSTGNEAVATVEDGVVTAVGLGSTYVKVTSVADASLSDSCLITVSYVPADYVDLYSLQYNSASFTQTVQTGLVAATTERLLVGPADGWGSGNHYYNIANYDSLIIKLNFDASDAGKQVALRIAYDKVGVTLYEITYPTDGSTSLLYKVDISAKNQLDGMNFYNGAPHWSFTYSGTAAAQDVTIEYVALKLEDPNSVPSVTIDTDADAIVNVYSMTGVLVRRAVKFSEATEGLDKGLYIVGKKKVLVTR